VRASADGRADGGVDRRGDVQQHLDRLVHELKDGGRIRSPAIERAFRTVQRHRFLREFSLWDEATSRPIPVEFDLERPSDEALRTIYSDQALGTRFREGMPASSSSQPSVMADMLEALELGPRMRVLEIGTGTGYNAGLLAEIVGREGGVATLDIDEDISTEARRALEAAGYGRVKVVARDGAEGLPEASPFDRILVTVGCPDLSRRWHEQLAEGGRLVAPLEHAGLHPIVSLTKRGERLEGGFVCWSAFIPIRGVLDQKLAWPEVVLMEGERGKIDGPLWHGFGTGPPVPGWGVPRDVMDFFLFLALADRRAVALPPPPSSIGDRWEVGLLDSSGSALSGPSRIRVSGDEDLYSDLMRHHGSWQAADFPVLEDWHVTLGLHDVEERTPRFTVQRGQYRETAALSRH
jgi:protein-L-isoaspartate(D-aspartate) O-methyltransferase